MQNSPDTTVAIFHMNPTRGECNEEGVSVVPIRVGMFYLVLGALGRHDHRRTVFKHFSAEVQGRGDRRRNSAADFLDDGVNSAVARIVDEAVIVASVMTFKQESPARGTP